MAEVDLQALYDGLTPTQKDACRWYVGAALYDHQEVPEWVRAAREAMTDEQKTVLNHMVQSSTYYRPSEDDS